MDQFNELPLFPLQVIFRHIFFASEQTLWHSDSLHWFPDIAMDESMPCEEEEELMKTYRGMASRRRALLSVSHVCKRWHSAAVQCPSLWTNMYISQHTSVASIDTWLLRSGASPIDITMDFAEGFGFPAIAFHVGIRERVTPLHKAKILNALNALKRGLHRWRGISITVASREDTATVLGHLSGLPQPMVLERLRIVCVGRGRHERSIHPYPRYSLFGGQVHTLAGVRLQGVPHSVGCHIVTSALTTLVLHTSSGLEGITWNALLALLRQAVNLESLTVWNMKFSGVPVWVYRASVFTLSRVSYLSIGRLALSFVTALLDTIHFPCVRHLTLDFGGANSAAAFQRLHTPNRHPHPLLRSVERFTLIGVRAPYNVIVDVIINLVSMTALELINAGPFFDVLEQLTIKTFHELTSSVNETGCVGGPAYAPLCPGLRKVTSTGVGALAMGGFVVARAVLGFRLETLLMSKWDAGEHELALMRDFVSSAESFVDN